jgi:A/G-specific adenine glycosylase
VLKLWEGLGYYSRARNLQKAARMIVERYGGEVPSEPDELRRLPGIGDYAAGAIASIAFSQRVPAVDGNVLRVLSRLLASRDDIADAETKNRFRELILEILPQDRPGDFNQALMDLGATVCVPGEAPRCESCPLAACCKGREAGIQGELPIKAPKGPRDVRDITVFIIESNGKILLVQRPPKGLLAGLWGPPIVDGWLNEKEAADWLGSRGAAIRSLRRGEDSKHIFTHVEWNMRAYLAEEDGFTVEGEFVWADADDLKQYAIPSAFKAYRLYF